MNNGNKPLWTVTKYEDSTEFGGESGIIPTINVHFKMHDGTESLVTIPRREFDPDAVGDLVHEHASKIFAVKSMQGPDVVEMNTPQVAEFQPYTEDQS